MSTEAKARSYWLRLRGSAYKRRHSQRTRKEQSKASSNLTAAPNQFKHEVLGLHSVRADLKPRAEELWEGLYQFLDGIMSLPLQADGLVKIVKMRNAIRSSGETSLLLGQMLAAS